MHLGRRSAVGAAQAQGSFVAHAPSRTITDASSKVASILSTELKHEQEQYEQSSEVSKFLKSSSFKFVDTTGDVNMALEKDMGDRIVRVEWQLTSPFNPDMDMVDDGDQAHHDATELRVSIENKETGVGVTFYCNTQTGEDHRYVIGNVKAYGSKEERDCVSGYHGPHFEDLDDKLQEGLDEYLAEVGINSEVCDFVDAMAVDKEQREYVRWLELTKKFFE